jgi:hypothetical protein
MLDEMFWFATGLIVGWNLLPQPTWVKTIYDKVISKLFPS